MSDRRMWYLIYTKPRHEYLAREHLERQGYVTYLPIYEHVRRRNRRYLKAIEPYFPRYLFIQLDSESDNWAPIRSTVGVSKMVRFGIEPMIVPDELVRSLKLNEDTNGLQIHKKKNISPGDRVEIINGPFAGYEGIYQQNKSADRVAVLLDLVGKNAALTLSVHDLQVAYYS